jgi:hypothetical protein
MGAILWIVVALGLVALVVVAAGYRTRSVLPPLVLPEGERLQATSLQRLARWSLALSLVPLILAAGMVAAAGPADYADDDTTRLVVTGLLLAAMVVLAAPTMLAGTWAAGDDRRLDERDRAILARAPAGQAAAMLAVLAVWVIALQETYRGAPGIPVTCLYLMFWSCLLVSLVASNAGILLGYRRS